MPHPAKKGFTLIEILIVVAIIALLAVLAIFMLMNNLGKSRDGKRKADLDRIKIAFEEYYVDEGAYPPEDILEDCGGETLKPYLSTIPCDPRTKRPYCYIYDADYNGQNYRLLSSLEVNTDPIIANLGCNDPDEYCGFETNCTAYGSRFNYGVASSNVLVNSENIGSGQIGASPSPTPTPSPSMGPLPSTNPGIYACSPSTPSNPSQCNNYGPDPAAAPYYCPLTFSNSGTCNNYCPGSPAYTHCRI